MVKKNLVSVFYMRFFFGLVLKQTQAFTIMNVKFVLLLRKIKL